MRSRGSVEFSRQPIAWWVERLGHGAKKSSVGNWRVGLSAPPDHMRERIAEHGGPDPDAWDEAYAPPAADVQLPDDSEAPPATADSVADIAARQQRQLLLNMQALEQPNDLTPDQRIRAQADLAKILDQLSRFTGVKLTTRQILASPLWGEVCSTIVTALEPWPDAMRAVADALEQLKAPQ